MTTKIKTGLNQYEQMMSDLADQLVAAQDQIKQRDERIAKLEKIALEMIHIYDTSSSPELGFKLRLLSQQARPLFGIVTT
jgi:hypothetical protein